MHTNLSSSPIIKNLKNFISGAEESNVKEQASEMQIKLRLSPAHTSRSNEKNGPLPHLTP